MRHTAYCKRSRPETSTPSPLSSTALSLAALMKEFVWEEPYLNLSRDYGSGYPGDENCVRWLSSTQQVVFGYPSIVRFSWSTTREALDKSGACKVQWECDEDQSLGGADIKNYFAVGAKKPIKRSDYFTRRKMKRLDDSFLR